MNENTSYHFFSKIAGSGNDQRDIIVGVRNNTIYIKKSGVIDNNAIPLPSTGWHHFVWVQNENKTDIYIDNVNKSTSTEGIVDAMTWNTSTPLIISNHHHVAYLQFIPYAINELQIQDLYTIFNSNNLNS